MEENWGGTIIVYKGCVGSVLGYGAENWSVCVKVLKKLVSTERKMLRMM